MYLIWTTEKNYAATSLCVCVYFLYICLFHVVVVFGWNVNFQRKTFVKSVFHWSASAFVSRNGPHYANSIFHWILTSCKLGAVFNLLLLLYEEQLFNWKMCFDQWFVEKNACRYTVHRKNCFPSFSQLDTAAMPNWELIVEIEWGKSITLNTNTRSKTARWNSTK